MKKAKAAYISIIMLCTLVFTGIIGWLSVYTTNSILRENALTVMQLSCEKTRLNFDAVTNSIEQSVDTLSALAILSLEDFERFKTDNEYVNEYSEQLSSTLLNAAYSTTGAMSVYIRYNNEFASPTAGLFYVLNKATGEFENTQTTNLDNPNGENTIWYTLPIEKGCGVWTEPYHNKLIDYYMISYTVPIYIDGEFVGVVGMDIDTDYLVRLVQGIDVYDTGYAFLVSSEGQVIYHQKMNFMDKYTAEFKNSLELTELPGGYIMYNNGTESKMFTKTNNGMNVGISAPNEEIYSDSTLLKTKVIAIIIVGAVCAALLAIIIVSRLFSLSEMDTLTGARNRKGFENIFKTFDGRKLDEYAIFIFDIDNFKNINDSYGHNAGDKALVNAAAISRKILKSNPFARWGGDEFIGMIPKNSAIDVLETLRDAISNAYDPLYGSFTISIGVSDIDSRKSLKENSGAADSALYISKTNGKNKITKA